MPAMTLFVSIRVPYASISPTVIMRKQVLREALAATQRERNKKRKRKAKKKLLPPRIDKETQITRTTPTTKTTTMEINM